MKIYLLYLLLYALISSWLIAFIKPNITIIIINHFKTPFTLWLSRCLALSFIPSGPSSKCRQILKWMVAVSNFSFSSLRIEVTCSFHFSQAFHAIPQTNLTAFLPHISARLRGLLLSMYFVWMLFSPHPSVQFLCPWSYDERVSFQVCQAFL